MKTIVDTCVWSLALRRRNEAQSTPEEQKLVERLREEIQSRRAILVGPIRQEVLSGIRDEAQFARIRELLEPFADEPILGPDYIEAARLFNVCRKHGLQCGPVDILLCAVSVRLGYAILTSDQGLLRSIETLRSEGVSL